MKLYLHLSTWLLISFSCLGQEIDSSNTNHIDFDQTFHYPWLSLGVSVGYQLNYAHVPDDITIPSSGETNFTAVPTISFGLRAQREFAPHWLWRAGLDVSAFGFRMLTIYEGINVGGMGFLREQTQVSLGVQYFPLHYNPYKVRPYLRLGALANVMTGPSKEIFIRSSRQINDLPTYRDYIIFVTEPWVRPGLMLGVGFSRRIRSGFMFDLAFTAYRGFTKLTKISYVIERDDRANPPEELLKTEIINRGSFIGVEGSIYLPPFGFKKIRRELRKRQ